MYTPVGKLTALPASIGKLMLYIPHKKRSHDTTVNVRQLISESSNTLASYLVNQSVALLNLLSKSYLRF